MPLKVYDVSLQMVRVLKQLVDAVSRRDRALADQLRRAASSVVLNIAEGTESAGGNKRLRYRTALGSAGETGAALDVAAAWDYVPRQRVLRLQQRLESVRKMLWPLAR